jgi:ABC-type sugar transport system substrate-binding protein
MLTRRTALAGVATAAALAYATVPTDATAQAKPLRIGLASREITNDYNRDIIAGAKRVIEAAGGTLVVADGQTDPRKHNENIENLINSGVTGLIIQLGNAQQLAPVVATANKAGIPVVTTSVGATTPGALTEVGGDESLMAVLMNRALLSSINYQGDVYVVWVPGAPLLETRKRVLEAMCKDFPRVRLHEVPTEHSPARVQAQMEDILTANAKPGSIAAVWGAYDLLVSGAVEAIRRAGRNEIKVASIDGDRIGFQMLLEEDSPFVATVVQDVPRIGELAAQTVLAALKGEKNFPSTIFTNAWVTTHANVVASAEKRWGPKVWDELQIARADVEKRYPQTEQVLIMRPTLP